MPAVDSAPAALLSVFNALPGAFLLLSPALVIEAATDEYVAATLVLRERMLGRGLFDVFPENDATAAAQGQHNLRASLALALATGQPQEMARQHYDVPDPAHPGQFVERHWLPRNTPVLDAAGQVTHIIHAVTNVTGQVQAEHRLRESQATAERERALLDALLTQAPVAIGLFQGPELRITNANAQMCAIWGRPPEQVLGRPLLEALPELRGQGFDTLLNQVLTTHVPVTGTETPARMLRDGQLQTTYYNFVYQPLYDAQGGVLGVVDVAVEVTEQVQARRELQNLNEELETRVQQRTAQLEQQQRHLRQILGQVPAAIATLSGPEHRYSFFNDAYQRLSGGRTGLGRSVPEVLPEVVKQGFVGLLDEVYRTGRPFQGTETRADLLDPATGQLMPHYIDFIYQPLTGEAGQPEGVLAFVVDVTERVRAREQAAALQAALLAATQHQLRERQTYQQIFAETPAAICIQRGPGHRYEYVNAAYQQFFPERALLGRLVAEVLPEIVPAGILALLDGVYETGETFFGHEVPLTLAAPDGGPDQERFFTFTYQAYRESGEIVGISTFAYDVSGQVRARRQREAAQQQLYALFMQAPFPIVILEGPELIYQLVNPAYQLIFPGRELLHKPLLAALPELAGSPIPAVLGQVYATGETYVARELPLRLARHEGAPLEEIITTFTYQARRNEHGEVDGVFVFAQEITDQVRARQVVEEGSRQARALADELTTTNEQLTRANVDLDNFIYTASHDLKAPITNIEGLLHALREHLPGPVRQAEPVPQLLDMMQGAIERFQLTISQLSDITQLQLAHAAPAEAVDLAALTEAVRLDLAPALAAAAAELQVDVAACPSVSFAPQHLRSIVYNLLSNAIKYHAPGRRPLVQLRTFRHPATRHAVLEVQDNGLGLDAAQQNRLFGMFQRLHTHVEGSGIGLYMVKKIVENAGGTIEVESQLGVGSTFTVSFPD